MADNRFEVLLSGGDLRSIGFAEKVVKLIRSQDDFDELFRLLKHPNRIIAMRAADAAEKFTRKDATCLVKHSAELIQLALTSKDKEHKWHLSQMLVRLPLSVSEVHSVWTLLYSWATDKNESRIVRVNAIDGLAVLSGQNRDLRMKFVHLLTELEKEKIPSLQARIRKLKKKPAEDRGK